MKSILIIEDQSDIRRLIRWALEFEDIVFHEAARGATGLAAAVTIRPDLILLDVMMPGEFDGLQVCSALKADPVTARIPVVLLSALAQDADRKAGMQAGADGYLMKPFSPQALIETVYAHIAP